MIDSLREKLPIRHNNKIIIKKVSDKLINRFTEIYHFELLNNLSTFPFVQGFLCITLKQTERSFNKVLGGSNDESSYIKYFSYRLLVGNSVSFFSIFSLSRSTSINFYLAE